jgi:hypothetical protein
MGDGTDSIDLTSIPDLSVPPADTSIPSDTSLLGDTGGLSQVATPDIFNSLPSFSSGPAIGPSGGGTIRDAILHSAITGGSMQNVQLAGPLATAAGSLVVRGVAGLSSTAVAAVGFVAQKFGFASFAAARGFIVAIVRKYGPLVAATMLGLAAENLIEVAFKGHKRRRHRGITYRDIRTTRRTVRKVLSLAHMLAGLRHTRGRTIGRGSSIVNVK